MKISTVIETLVAMEKAHGDIGCVSLRIEDGKEVTDGLCIGTGLGVDNNLYVLVMTSKTASEIEVIQEQEGGPYEN